MKKVQAIMQQFLTLTHMVIRLQMLKNRKLVKQLLYVLYILCLPDIVG